jgi:hypothetical protein
MDTNYIVAQVFGVLSMVSSICSMQFKKRRAILVALFCLSMFAALNMIFLNSWSATYITFFGILEMLINHLFERKKKEVPKFVVGIYIICNIVLGVLTFEKVLDVIPILAATVFCFTLLAKKEQSMRKLMIINQSLWLVFDLSVGAYALACSNILTIVSTAIAFHRTSKEEKEAKAKRKASKRSASKKKKEKR